MPMGTVVIRKAPGWKRQDMFYIFSKSMTFNTPLLKLLVFPMKSSWDTIKFYGWCFSCLFIVLLAFLLHTPVHAFFLLYLPLHSICFLFLSLDFLFFWQISLDDPSKKENADCPRLGHRAIKVHQPLQTPKNMNFQLLLSPELSWNEVIWNLFELWEW